MMPGDAVGRDSSGVAALFTVFRGENRVFWLNGADVGHENEMTGDEMTGHGNEMTGNYIGHGTSGRDFARFAGALLRQSVGRDPKEKSELLAAFAEALYVAEDVTKTAAPEGA